MFLASLVLCSILDGMELRGVDTGAPRQPQLSPLARLSAAFSRWGTPGMCAAILFVTLAVYLPAIRGGFIWDDNAHVTRPDLLPVGGLWRIWFEPGATQQYYPVLHGAFWLEHRFWGGSALGYHLLNVLLHAWSACLLAVLLRRLAIPGAWLAAWVFALHPVCVESVAWIAEQKNTLSTAFYLLAALVYFKWRERSGLLYWLATGLFILALLSKSVTATLPAALLVILWWKRGALSWRQDVRPLIPWFVLGAAAGVMTAWVERTLVGAKGAAYDLGPLQRCLLAGRAVWFYLGKLLWPADLIFIYPRWELNASAWWQYLPPAALLALLGCLWSLSRRGLRGPLASALFFAGSLAPALGFFNVYPFVYSYVADHFQYLACLGVIALAAAGWAGWRVRGGVSGAGGKGGGAIAPLVVAVAVTAVLGILTWRQNMMYRNAETLYRTTLAKNPESWMAHNNLGQLLDQSGRTGEAIAEYRESLRLKPDARVHFNLGVALASEGRIGEAILHYEAALKLDPTDAEAHINLALLCVRMGRLDEAITHDEAALRIRPSAFEAHNNLGNIRLGQGRIIEAGDEFRAALRTLPDYATAHNGLGAVLMRTGRAEEAIGHFREALRLKPDYAAAACNLGSALAETGRAAEAVHYYEEALRMQPNLVQARTALERLRGRAPESPGRN